MGCNDSFTSIGLSPEHQPSNSIISGLPLYLSQVDHGKRSSFNLENEGISVFVFSLAFTSDKIVSIPSCTSCVPGTPLVWPDFGPEGGGSWIENFEISREEHGSAL